MFVILQKYDFSSKSQRKWFKQSIDQRCLWYCKSTIFQANHNSSRVWQRRKFDVCDTAKVRFFKQITTTNDVKSSVFMMFVILQKYDFSSKSQRKLYLTLSICDVCDTAKVRFFKQITTADFAPRKFQQMFVILQKYDFSSKSQQVVQRTQRQVRCLWYCKSTIFQANHNNLMVTLTYNNDVCDTAKVRFFKQITTHFLFTKQLG